VTVDGFYDAVRTVTPAERQDLARVPFDETVFKRGLGVTELVGEAEYTPLERTWIRPTLEVNGIWGGFQGEGAKTIIPAHAHAKISARLVADQDPIRIFEAFRDYDAGAAHVQTQHFKDAQQFLPRHLAETPRIINVNIPQDDWSELGEMAVQ